MYYSGAKYKNKKVEIDGITFDSRKEADRYAKLKMLEAAGAIKNLELQKEFELLPPQRRWIDGKWKVIERAVKYKADFYYYDKIERKYVVEDTKGFKTKDYILKRKMMLYFHNIQIVEL
jgi:hypothetical protein